MSSAIVSDDEYYYITNLNECFVGVNEKLDITSMLKSDTIEATLRACAKIFALSTELHDTVYCDCTVEESKSKSVRVPGCKIADPVTKRLVPLNDNALYPSHTSLPKYTYFAEQYNPQAAFWEKVKYKLLQLQRPTSLNPLSIMTSHHELATRKLAKCAKFGGSDNAQTRTMSLF